MDFRATAPPRLWTQWPKLQRRGLPLAG